MTYGQDSNHGGNGGGRGYDNGRAGSQQQSQQDDRKLVSKAELKIQPGRYRAICVGHGWGKGTQEGQIGAVLKIVEGEYAGEIRTWYGSFSEAAAEYTVRGMRALGFKGDDLRDCRSMYEGSGGTVASITIEHDEYKGSWKEKIAWVNFEGAGFKEPLEGQEFESFAARMRGTLKRFGGGGGSSAPSGGGYGSNAGGGQQQQGQQQQQQQQQQRGGYGQQGQGQPSSGRTDTAPAQQQQQRFGDTRSSHTAAGGDAPPWGDEPPPGPYDDRGPPPRGTGRY